MWGHHQHHQQARRFGGRDSIRGDRSGRGFGGRFGEGHGEGRRRVVDGGELRLLLLRLLADEPRHGYDLIRAIEERTGGGYAPSPGVVYPTLTMLQDMALIAEQASEGGSRRSFAITAEGEAHLAERAEEVAAILARLDAIAQMAQRTDGGPVRRAMMNLRTVLRDRLTKDGTADATLHEIAALLDEAAQRIERL